MHLELFGTVTVLFNRRRPMASPHQSSRSSFTLQAATGIISSSIKYVCELSELVLLAFAALGISYCMRNAMNACRNATNAYRNAAACHEDYRLAAAAVTMEYAWPWKGSEEC